MKLWTSSGVLSAQSTHLPSADVKVILNIQDVENVEWRTKKDQIEKKSQIHETAEAGIEPATLRLLQTASNQDYIESNQVIYK
jgi:hypothetical protein